MDFKVVYIDSNFIDIRYANGPGDGDRFYTHGFGSLYARMFKKYNPDVEVECWKADSRINNILCKTIDGVGFKVFPSLKMGPLGHYSLSLLKEIRKTVKSNQRVIFNLSSIRHLLFYSIAPLLKTTPFVVQHHGESTTRYKVSTKRGGRKLFYLFQLNAEKRSFRQVDIFYVLDLNIVPFLPDTITADRIIQRTTGVNTELFEPVGKKAACSILKLDESKKYILYVGRLSDTKRVDMLINSFNVIKTLRNDVALLLAGTEKTDKYYKKAVDAGAIIYGVIEQSELKYFLSLSEVYVLPKLSDNHSLGGIGVLPIQALLCGTPIVGSTLRNLPAELKDRTGICTTNEEELTNALNSILDNKNKYMNLREMAVEYYSWETISRKTDSDYKYLVKKYEKEIYYNP